MAKVVIIGAGGHAKVIADIIIKRGETLVGFLDDHLSGIVLGYPILGTLSDINKYEDCMFTIGIGDNHIRKKIAESQNLKWYTAIHPAACIGDEVEIGEGSVVMARAVINPSAKVGKHCIINTASVVEHDNIIEDYTHISPSATLCGTVRVGTMTQVGAGATIKNNISVCSGCIVGAGAVVVKNLTEPGIYIGVPAEKI